MIPHYSFFICTTHLFSIAEDIVFLVLLQENLPPDCNEFGDSPCQHTPLCSDLPTKVGQGYSRGTKSKSQGQKKEETGGSVSLKFLC